MSGSGVAAAGAAGAAAAGAAAGVAGAAAGAGAKEFIAGEYGYTLNVEGIFEEDASVSASGLSYKDLLTDLLAGTSVTVVMTTNSSA